MGAFPSPEEAQQALASLSSHPCCILDAIVGATVPGIQQAKDATDAAATQITLLAASLRYCDASR